MTNRNPIGVFDSGLGGLSLARSIHKELPNENLLYVADSFYAPYGDKSKEFIGQRSTILVNFLLEKNAKAIVVACNTATVSVVNKLRSEFSIPIIGIEPGVKPATFSSQSGIVGVLATEQTLKSSSFNYLVRRFSANIKIEIQPCPGLVEQVEKTNLDGADTVALIKKYVFPLLEKGADTLVLGCTHYVFLIPLIEKIVGVNVEIIKTNTAVAKQVARRLKAEGLLSPNDKLGNALFWTSDNKWSAHQKISQLWGEAVNVLQI